MQLPFWQTLGEKNPISQKKQEELMDFFYLAMILTQWPVLL